MEAFCVVRKISTVEGVRCRYMVVLSRYAGTCCCGVHPAAWCEGAMT